MACLRAGIEKFETWPMRKGWRSRTRYSTGLSLLPPPCVADKPRTAGGGRHDRRNCMDRLFRSRCLACGAVMRRAACASRPAAPAPAVEIPLPPFSVRRRARLFAGAVGRAVVPSLEQAAIPERFSGGLRFGVGRFHALPNRSVFGRLRPTDVPARPKRAKHERGRDQRPYGSRDFSIDIQSGLPWQPDGREVKPWR